MKIEVQRFDDLFDLADAMYHDACDECMNVSLIANYDTCIQMLKYLIVVDASEYDVLDFDYLEIMPEEYEGYDGPYSISLTDIGSLNCVKALSPKCEYYIIDDEKVYTSLEYLKNVKENAVRDETCIVGYSIGDEEFEDFDEDKKHIVNFLVNDDEKVCGFEIEAKSEKPYCFTARFCSCEPDEIDVDKMFNLIDVVIEHYTNFSEGE